MLGCEPSFALSRGARPILGPRRSRSQSRSRGRSRSRSHSRSSGRRGRCRSRIRSRRLARSRGLLLVLMGGTYIGSGLIEEAFSFTRSRRADDFYYLGSMEAAEEEEEADEEARI